MPKGGMLTIETRQVQLTPEYYHRRVVPSGAYVMVAVTDTGVGMSPETQSRIFEPFFTTKDAGHGTGLGLATVYGIVKQSGGFVWVYSELGLGTTFKIYLPIVPEDDPVDHVQAAHPVTALDRQAGAGGHTILLAEDERAVRVLARTFLERAGYTVLEADGPAAAIDLASRESEPIGLLLTDIVMPGSSGTELYARLSAAQPGLKVLFMSGYTDASAVRHGLLQPGVAFLQKPFTAQTLVERVREVISQPPRPH